MGRSLPHFRILKHRAVLRDECRHVVRLIREFKDNRRRLRELERDMSRERVA